MSSRTWDVNFVITQTPGGDVEIEVEVVGSSSQLEEMGLLLMVEKYTRQLRGRVALSPVQEDAE